MYNINVEQAAALCGGRLYGKAAGERAIASVVIDSRNVKPGDLFVAYRGEKADGHDYIKTALDKGASCCLAERLPEGADGGIILVPEVQAALEKLFCSYRQSLTLPVVGITGSVGKTTAKEMVWSVLSQRYNTLKTEGNLNNQIGVPMTLSRVSPEHEIAVVEMGISGFGEMRRLAKMAKPDIAVFTVIGHAHLEFLHDLEGVFKAKTEMLEEMSDDGIVIANGDDELLLRLKCRQRLLRFGLGKDCEVRAENISVLSDYKTVCDIVYNERRIKATIPAYGRHMVYAALEGAAVGFVKGLDDEEISRGISSFENVSHRGAVEKTGYINLVDDSYNANPDSMQSAICSLVELPGRKVCIFSDMLEMGSQTEKMHHDIGAFAAEHGVELVLCFGDLGRIIAEGAGDKGRYFDSREELIASLPGILRKGDSVLVKASRGMHIETVAETLKRKKI